MKTASQLQRMPGGSKPAPHAGQAFARYRMFDTLISSQIALPELTELPPVPASRDMPPRITVTLGASGSRDHAAFTRCHDWRDHAGRLLCRCARRADEYRLWLPQQASFHLGADGVIHCTPAPGVGQALLRHLLLNQVLPRCLAHSGELVLHASAVTLPNGHTVAFLGDSGRGKSTLAYYCYQQGADLVDDDCIVLRLGDGGVSITGGVPTLRLYPDSLHALGHDPLHFAPYAESTDKQQMCLPPAATGASQPRPLQALFLLGAPHTAAAGNPVRIDPAAGQAALMAIVRCAFNLNPADPGTMTRTFQRAAAALTQGLPVYHLRYPRDHGALAQVLQAVLNPHG